VNIKKEVKKELRTVRTHMTLRADFIPRCDKAPELDNKSEEKERLNVTHLY
jgi:hypothetical protein